MLRIDLHTHSQASTDGALSRANYQSKLQTGLDYIAVTDHDEISFAQSLVQELGPRIIVGEEISTPQGEVIGLFLKEAIRGLDAIESMQAIKAQGGLVYVPHPFETARHGLSLAVLDQAIGLIDIVETHNGRAVYQNRSEQAQHWAVLHNIAQAASSDAHGPDGWGRTYTSISAAPTPTELVGLLKAPDSSLTHSWMGMKGLAYPKLNRLKKRWRRHV